MADQFEEDLGIAAQRYEYGDLVVHLSNDKGDTLVLPTSVLTENSKWFEAVLKRWQKPALAEGTSVVTWRLGLTYDPEIQTRSPGKPRNR